MDFKQNQILNFEDWGRKETRCDVFKRFGNKIKSIDGFSANFRMKIKGD